MFLTSNTARTIFRNQFTRWIHEYLLQFFCHQLKPILPVWYLTWFFLLDTFYSLDRWKKEKFWHELHQNHIFKTEVIMNQSKGKQKNEKLKGGKNVAAANKSNWHYHTFNISMLKVCRNAPKNSQNFSVFPSFF